MEVDIGKDVERGHHGETGDHIVDDLGLYVTHIERDLASCMDVERVLMCIRVGLSRETRFVEVCREVIMVKVVTISLMIWVFM